jgi:HEAT repeat protein
LLQDWQNLIRETQNRDDKVRLHAKEALGYSFSQAPDKTQAQQDLHSLTMNKDSSVRTHAARALGQVFSYVPDKTQAQQDLHRLTKDNVGIVRRIATIALGDAFSQVPDKIQAQQDLHKRIKDKDGSVRMCAASALGDAFSHLPNQDQAQQDLHKLTKDKVSGAGMLLWDIADALGKAFPYVPNQDQAQQDLHRLTQDKKSYVKMSAIHVLGNVFSQVPDKSQAQQDLHRLTQDQESNVRNSAINALGDAFSQVPDKSQAQQDLHRLILDEDFDVRKSLINALNLAFSQMPDKTQAQQDLHKLSQDEECDVRMMAAYCLGENFSLIPDKAQAQLDLHRLTEDEDSGVRMRAAFDLSKACSQVPDKVQAQFDLHRLTQDEDSGVRQNTAAALGEAFPYVPDKSQAKQDLHTLTLIQAGEGSVRTNAYYSLGRASVCAAAEANDNITSKRELEAAISYFGKSQDTYYSPANFCYPFYRSYYAITFEGATAEEIEKYLIEAKKAVGHSKSKDELLKVIENLAGALQESQCLKDKSNDDIKRDLNAYRWYCEKAANHMAAAEERSPFAIKCMRKCNPLLEKRIQDIIGEIQQKTNKIHQITCDTGTEYEILGAEIQHAASHFSTDDIVKTQRCSTSIIRKLETFCKLLPEVSKNLACSAVEEIRTAKEFPDKLEKIDSALSYVISAVETALQYKYAIASIRAEVEEVKTSIASHDEKSEWRKDIIIDRIDFNGSIIIEAIQRASKEASSPDPDLVDLLRKLEAYILDLEKYDLLDVNGKKIIEETKRTLNKPGLIEDPVLRFSLKLEGTLPLIPKVLEILNLPSMNATGKLELSSGINLKIAWDRVVKRFSSKPQS